MSDGQRLRALRRWDAVTRGRFEVEHDGHAWVVDVDYFDFGEKVRLYRDGLEVEARRSPAEFELGGGARVVAEMGLLGMRRAELIADGGGLRLEPVAGTAEGWRLRLERERPALSRAIGAVSWTVLVIALVLEVPQLLALADAAPFTAPAAVNTLVGFAALAAAVERALRFKCSRWLG